MRKIISNFTFLLFSILLLSCFFLPGKVHCKHGKPPFLVVHSLGHGIFADMAAVIGMLDYYESLLNSKIACAGFSVEFGENALYYDADKGPNYWDYYMEPLVLGNKTGTDLLDFDLKQCNQLAAHTLFKMPFLRAHELVKKYIRFKPFIHEKVLTFIENNFKDFYIIGVHYRGTNKFLEAPLVSYEDMATEVRKVIATLDNTAFKIFVASDEQRFIDYMEAQFPDLIVKTDANRSLDGTPHYMEPKNQYQNGEDAILDALLLSKTDFLIRTASNVSYFSILFNPDIAVVNVSDTYYSPDKNN